MSDRKEKQLPPAEERAEAFNSIDWGHLLVRLECGHRITVSGALDWNENDRVECRECGEVKDFDEILHKRRFKDEDCCCKALADDEPAPEPAEEIPSAKERAEVFNSIDWGSETMRLECGCVVETSAAVDFGEGDLIPHKCKRSGERETTPIVEIVETLEEKLNAAAVAYWLLDVCGNKANAVAQIDLKGADHFAWWLLESDFELPYVETWSNVARMIRNWRKAQD